MLFQVNPPSIENSQLVTFPTFPVRFIVPAFAVAQTVAFDDAVPATVAGSTVIVEDAEGTAGQIPFETLARYIVVTVMLL